jgi:hypothetical protein
VLDTDSETDRIARDISWALAFHALLLRGAFVRYTLPWVGARRPTKTYEDHLSESAFQSRVIGIARENGFVLPPVDPTSKSKRPRLIRGHEGEDGGKGHAGAGGGPA